MVTAVCFILLFILNSCSPHLFRSVEWGAYSIWSLFHFVRSVRLHLLLSHCSEPPAPSESKHLKRKSTYFNRNFIQKCQKTPRGTLDAFVDKLRDRPSRTVSRHFIYSSIEALASSSELLYSYMERSIGVNSAGV